MVVLALEKDGNSLVTDANNRLEFRVYWQGTANLDVAAIRIR